MSKPRDPNCPHCKDWPDFVEDVYVYLHRNHIIPQFAYRTPKVDNFYCCFCKYMIPIVEVIRKEPQPSAN